MKKYLIPKLFYTVLLTLLSTSCLAIDAVRNEDGLTALHLAAGAGDAALVEKLIENGADLFTLDSKMGVSVLHKAVYSGDAGTVNLLLQNGALVNLQSPSNGDTPLHDAIYFRRGRDLSVIQTLLKYKPSLAIQNRAGLTPIESANVLNAVDVVKLLKKYQLDRQSEKSRNLLAAVRGNNLSLVTTLLQNEDAKVLAETDDQGFSPLLWASRQGYLSIVNILLDHGADPNQRDQWMKANSGHKAAFWGHADVMKLLIAKGLDINARGGYNGYTPLHDAVSGNHLAVAQVLVDSGADITVRGHDGKTPLDIAKANGNKTMIEMITKKRQATDI